MTKREEKAAQRRLEKVRAAFVKLTKEQQHTLFLEFSQCTCADLVREVVKHPRAAIGAAAGALFAEMFLGPPKKPSPEVEGVFPLLGPNAVFGK